MSTIAGSPAATKHPKSIVVDALARVEGEGGLTIQLKGGRVADVKLRIYEPPRFFEAFLRGPRVHRGARHHRADLRHLPGRVPDELDPRDGGGVRRRA